MPELSLQHVSKRYGIVPAVTDLSLDVEPGSLVALLGPSGCGKTTTLRMLGGFLEPSEGRIELRGEDVTGVPPHRRDTAMVFQSYALFPHLTVAQNIAYGLKRRRVKGAELRHRVSRTLEQLQLMDLADRRPGRLSGGQQQRVAVGRALVLNPAVLLLDEPFSALDAQLRESTRMELRRLQQELSITAVFVTHDQEEAMSIADRVAVMNRGRLEQVGSPQEVYELPATRFVAGFIGAANLIHGSIKDVGRDSAVLVSAAGWCVEGAADQRLSVGSHAVAVLRPEDLEITDAPDTCTVSARVDMTSFLGSSGEVQAHIDGGQVLAIRGKREIASTHHPGDTVHVRWRPDAVRILP